MQLLLVATQHTYHCCLLLNDCVRVRLDGIPAVWSRGWEKQSDIVVRPLPDFMPADWNCIEAIGAPQAQSSSVGSVRERYPVT